MSRCNEYMFREVSCHAYLKKISDGKYINVDKDGNAEYVDTSREVDGDVWHEPIEEDDYDGSEKFLKTYYEYKKKEFTGVVVGFKMVVLTGYLTVNIRTSYNGSESTIVEKSPKEQTKCALVYYGCNRSRLVPMKDLEIKEVKEDVDIAN